MAADPREASLTRAQRRVVRDHAFFPNSGYPAIDENLFSGARGQCLHFLCDLSAPDVLADGSGSLLPILDRGCWDCSSSIVLPSIGRNYRRRSCLASPSLSLNRLVVVYHHACTGDRDCSGG